MTIQKLRLSSGTWTAFYGSTDGTLPSSNGNDRSGLVAGTYKPDATTTGLLPGWGTGDLGVINGDQTITTAGTIVENKMIYGRVLVRAANVTIRNCYVRGAAAATSATGLIEAGHTACVNLVVEDCLLVPDNPSTNINGITGHDYTIRRSEMYGSVDGAGALSIYNNNGPINVWIEACYIHDLYYYSPDPGHGDNRTHNDCIQVQGNSNITIVGNTLNANASTTVGNGYPGASPTPPAGDIYFPSVTGQAIGITPNIGPVTDLLIEKNWLDYGAQSITVIPGNVGSPDTTGIIRNNKFGHNQPNISRSGVSARRPIIIDPSLTFPSMPTSTDVDTQGNVYEDTGLPITVYRMTG